MFIEKLVAGEHLTKLEAKEVCGAVLAGAEPLQVASVLTLLRRNGESAAEVAGFVEAMTEACVPVPVSGKMLDIVGTGGDGAHTINISTAAAVLAAAAGAKTAKAGNRSVSSQCGSADVLEALGVRLDLDAAQMGQCVEACGIGFMFAPVNHPAMRVVAPIRKVPTGAANAPRCAPRASRLALTHARRFPPAAGTKALGVRSVFNLMGPLTNAAGAQHVVVGVFDAGLMDLMADTLAEVGHLEHGVVIHGAGLDEVSPLGPSEVLEIRNEAPPGVLPKRYRKTRKRFDPLDVGVPRCTLEDLRGGGAAENAALLREALAAGSHAGGKRDAVVLNAGMGLYVFGLAASMEGGVALARETLKSGAGLAKLDEWIATTQRL